SRDSTIWLNITGNEFAARRPFLAVSSACCYQEMNQRRRILKPRRFQHSYDILSILESPEAVYRRATGTKPLRTHSTGHIAVDLPCAGIHLNPVGRPH
ncbi:MAG: hypothetical protein WCA20_03905, partial [Candidatus Sulfotelmatobacter sp.]